MSIVLPIVRSIVQPIVRSMQNTDASDVTFVANTRVTDGGADTRVTDGGTDTRVTKEVA